MAFLSQEMNRWQQDGVGPPPAKPTEVQAMQVVPIPSIAPSGPVSRGPAAEGAACCVPGAAGGGLSVARAAQLGGTAGVKGTLRLWD